MFRTRRNIATIVFVAGLAAALCSLIAPLRTSSPPALAPVNPPHGTPGPLGDRELRPFPERADEALAATAAEFERSGKRPSEFYHSDIEARLATVFVSWGEHDPVPALIYIESITPTYFQSAALGAAFGGWATSDPGTAISRYLDFRSIESETVYPPEPSIAFSRFFDALAEHGTPLVAGNIDRFQDKFDQRHLIAALIKKLSTDQAVSAVRSFAQPARRCLAIRCLAYKIADSEPSILATLIGELPEADRAAVGESVIRNSSWGASQRGADWAVANLPHSDLDEPLRYVLSQWGKSDRISAAGWLVRQPDTIDRTGLAKAFADLQKKFDPLYSHAWTTGRYPTETTSKKEVPSASTE